MIKNFLFHRVHPQRDELWDPMDVRLFEKCIGHISKKYRVLLLEDLVLRENGIVKDDCATIVFDDGFKDNIEYALPILDKFAVKASFYVVTDCIDRNLPTWTYILDYNFQNTRANTLDLSYHFIPENLRVNRFISREERVAFARKLKPLLKKLRNDQRDLVLSSVRETFEDVELPRLMMNWKDLQQIRDDGHYIGSHTVTHAMLGTIQAESAIRRELVGSGERIKEQLGYFPKTISYPVGSYNTTVMNLAQEVGYEIGLAVNQVPYNPRRQGRFEIPRIELYNEPWLKTRMRMGNLDHQIRKIWNRR